MSLPAGQGLSVLFVLADQWRRERRMLSLLGEEDPLELDNLVNRKPARLTPRAQLAADLGGEVMIQ